MNNKIEDSQHDDAALRTDMNTGPQHRFNPQVIEPPRLELDVNGNEDPLLIAQSLTFVTDDGTISQSFHTAPFSAAFKWTFFVIEALFVAMCIVVFPYGYHATIITISVGNLLAVAWFWYNSVKAVDISHSDGILNFWIGNFEVTVPFDDIHHLKPVRGRTPCSIVSFGLIPHRGYLSDPTDGVAIMTRMPSTPFWSWPRGAEGLGARSDRRCCFGLCGCPRLVIVFSPAGGGHSFINEVENEISKWEAHNARKRAQASGENSGPSPIYK